jgi:hypothetical protein
LVLALVKNAQEDGSLKVANVGELFHASGRSDCLASVTDKDVEVSSPFLLLLQTISYCYH